MLFFNYDTDDFIIVTKIPGFSKHINMTLFYMFFTERIIHLNYTRYVYYYSKYWQFWSFYKNFLLKKWFSEGERKTMTCYSTHSCTHWLILVCTPTGHWLCNPGTSGQCSDHLSYSCTWPGPINCLFNKELHIAVQF